MTSQMPPETEIAEALRLALRAEVNKVRGPKKARRHLWPEQLPVLSVIASREGAKSPYEVVNWAIGQIDMGQERSRGADALFGLSNDNREGVGKREDEAASVLGFKTGDSFRKSPKYGELLDEIADLLVEKALKLGLGWDEVPPAPQPVHPEHQGQGSPSNPGPLLGQNIDGPLEPAPKAATAHTHMGSKWPRAVMCGAALTASAIGYLLFWPQSDRPTWDYSKACTPAALSDSDEHDGCGAQGSKAVFNSGINFEEKLDVPDVGDERDFLQASGYGTFSYGDLKDVDQAERDTVLIRLFVHNNNEHIDARNVRVGLEIPDEVGTDLAVRGYVGADNADPSKVEDTVRLSGVRPFGLQYEPGSARVNGFGGNSDHSEKLSDEVVTGDGTVLTDSNLGLGTLSAGFVGEVVIKAKVVSAGS